jgi:hypothetical protein
MNTPLICVFFRLLKSLKGMSRIIALPMHDVIDLVSRAAGKPAPRANSAHRIAEPKPVFIAPRLRSQVPIFRTALAQNKASASLQANTYSIL